MTTAVFALAGVVLGAAIVEARARRRDRALWEALGRPPYRITNLVPPSTTEIASLEGPA